MGSRVVCATPHRGKTLNNYTLGDRLGKGAFAIVYKAIDLVSAEVAAVKQIPLEKIKGIDSIMSEIELLQELQHPNIVKYLGFMKDDNYLNIVLEYCENGSLTAILRKFGSFPENLISRYMSQVLEGLVYLHDQGTIHRDIKGANILTTKNGVAKLADFGVAMRMSTGSDPVERPGVVGTPHWMAPEIILRQEPSTSCDIWSLGATIVELKTGKPPYGNCTDIAAMYAIVQQDSPAMIPQDCSKSLEDFLTLCFEKDPLLRVKARDLLEHVWIRKFKAQLGIKAPEKAILEFNSVSRQKRLAVPSMLNLKQQKSDASMSFSSSEDIEQDFVTLNVFGAKEVKKDELAPVRAPLSAFVDADQNVLTNDDYDDAFDADFGELESVNKFSSAKSAPVYNSVERDPFAGFEDLLEDDLDEELLCAQREAKQLVSALTNSSTKSGYLRLTELILSKPSIQKELDQTRFLTKSLKHVANAPKDVVKAFLYLVDVCTPSGSHDTVISFCISGGLSFILQHTKTDAPLILRLLHKMTKVQKGRGVEEENMGIARQLAFREDAIAVLCSFFALDVSATPSTLLQASTVIIKVFEACGPRYRNDLWYHLNAYNLFKLLVEWLHCPFVLENNAENQLCANMYTLIASFERTTQEQLEEQVDSKILRRLMRAYIRLPLGSPHRQTLLEFYKKVSTLAPVLNAMYTGNVAPHLIAALRRALHDPEVSKSESRIAANCLVPIIFNYTRIERARQIEVAQHDVLRVLIDCVDLYPALREFVYPVFAALAHANYKDCWDTLKRSNGLPLFIDLITEPGWQAMAISAVSIWMQADPEFVKHKFTAKANVVITALASTQGSTYESVLSALTTLVDQNRDLCTLFDLSQTFTTFSKHIKAYKSLSSASLVQSLQVILWILTEHERETDLSDAKLEIQNSKLLENIRAVETDEQTPVPCKKLISQILSIVLVDSI